MTNDRAMELLAARAVRLRAERAERQFEAARAFAKTSEATEPKASDNPISAALGDTFASLMRETLMRSALAFADGLAVLTTWADDPCEVARWNIETRGYRLPLP